MEDGSLNHQQHLFFIERERNQFVPFWFLEQSTRKSAQEILKRSNGNVLMRKHSSFNDTGKYVITYLKDDSRDDSSFRHYFVLNSPDGFILDVKHKNNRPVNCLSEVMDLFIRLTGHGAEAIHPGSTDGYLPPNCISSFERYGNSTASANNYHQVNYSSDGVSYHQSNGFHFGNISPEIKPTDKSKHSYVNIPNASASSSASILDQNIRQANDTSPQHSYINIPQLSNSSLSKCTGHDYVNTQRTHSYINTKTLDEN